MFIEQNASFPFAQAAGSDWSDFPRQLLFLILAWQCCVVSAYTAGLISLSMVVSKLILDRFSVFSMTTIRVLMITEGFAAASMKLFLLYALDAHYKFLTKRVALDPMLLIMNYVDTILFTAPRAGRVMVLFGMAVDVVHRYY